MQGKSWIAGICFGLIGAQIGVGTPFYDRVEVAQVYHAQKMKLFVVERDLAMETFGRPWDFGNGTSNNFSVIPAAVGKVQIGGGMLQFQMAGNAATLGWGNFENAQARDQRVNLWPNWNIVEISLRQSANTNTPVTLHLWQDGKPEVAGRAGKSEESKILKGTNLQTLAFSVQMPAADGFSLKIEAPAETWIDIASVRVLQKEYTGCFRRTFELPKGRIWRAVAEVAKDATLLVNGRELQFQRYNAYDFVTTPVDLAPYLKVGQKNCVALYSRKLGDGHLAFLQGAVTMADGSVIRLDTPSEWKGAIEGPKDWAEPGFDDQAWKPAGKAGGFGDDYVVRTYPAYDGRLVLENPYGDDPQLFFRDTRPLSVRVRIPEGLGSQSPVIQWKLRRAAAEPSTNSMPEEVTRGRSAQFSVDRKSDSLVYAIAAGRQPRGVYLLDVSLQIGDQVLEKRIPEPLAVVGKIPMPEVAGTNYEDGLKLTLEDTIDFTNPQDPHANIESQTLRTKAVQGVAQPRIVHQDGLVYRETMEGAGSGCVAHFSYQFAFQKPSSFYLMVMEYPDNADRCVGVSVEALDIWGKRDRQFTYVNKTGPAVMTGFKHPVTGKMRELKWLHFSHTRDHMLTVASVANGTCAAAARVRIYRVDSELPAVRIAGSGERWLGLHTERAQTPAVIYGLDDPGYYQLKLFNQQQLDMVGAASQRLKWLVEGCENYARYLRFCGENLHVMGAFQYGENNTPYNPPCPFPSARIPVNDIRDVALRVLGENGIASISMVEYSVHQWLARRYNVNDAQVAAGADTIFPVSKDGKQAGGAGCVSQASFDHPAVQEAYLGMLDDLARKFSFSPAWKGVYIMAYPSFGGPVTYAPLNIPFDYDYSDATLAAFERDTGIKVPAEKNDPKRFEKRYVFLTSDRMKSKWIDWRCRTVRDLVVKSRDRLQKHRKDLQLYYGYYYDVNYLVTWHKSGRPYLDFMRDQGWDPTLFAKDAGIWPGRFFFPNGGSVGMLWGTYGYATVWDQETGADAIAAFARPSNRLAVLNTCWHEVDLLAPDSGYYWDGKASQAATNWPAPRAHVRYVSQPNNDNALENFTQAMIGADPEMIMYGFTDWMFPMGYEQELRQICRVLLPLPKGQFQPVQGSADFKHNLALRDLRQGSDYWFYAANPGYWPIKGEVTLSGVVQLVDPATDEPIPTQEKNGNTVVPIDLRGYGLVAFRSKIENRKSKIVAWTNAPVAESDLAHLRRIIAEARDFVEKPEVATAIDKDERIYVRETVTQAQADLLAGEYARAWARVTAAKFWSLVNDHLKKAAQYAVAIPGYTPRERTPDSIPALAVAKADVPPVIDGRLDDPAWQSASYTDGFVGVGITGGFLGTPYVATAAKAAYDDRHLYLGFVLAEKDVKVLKMKADCPENVLNAWDDAVALFINPNMSKVFQMAVNPAGLQYQADATGVRGYFRRYDKDLGPWQAAIQVTNAVWTVEIAIPYATLQAVAPKSGDQWRANFLRRYRNAEVPEMYWSMIKTSWYDLDRYGYLNFL